MDYYKTSHNKIDGIVNFFKRLEEWSFPVFTVNNEGLITNCNKFARDLFNIANEQNELISLKTVLENDSLQIYDQMLSALREIDFTILNLNLKDNGDSLKCFIFKMPDEKKLGSETIFITIPIDKKVAASSDFQMTTRIYRDLIEEAHEGIALVDSEENIIFCNTSFAKLVGYDLMNIIGVNLSDLMERDQFQMILEETEQRSRGMKSKYEILFKTNKGLQRKAIVSSSPIIDENGNYYGAVGVVMDISEQTRLNTELKAINKRLTFLQEIITLTHSRYTPEEIVERALEIILKFTGFYNGRVYLFNSDMDVIQIIKSRSNADGENILDKINFQDSELKDYLLQNEVSRLKTEEHIFLFPMKLGVEIIGCFCLFTPDQEFKLSKEDSDTLLSASGQLGNGIKRHQYQYDLRNSAKTFKRLFEQSTAAILILDTGFNINNFNSKAVKLLEESGDVLIRQNLLYILNDKKTFRDITSILVKGEKIEDMEHSIKLNSGKILYVLNNSVPLFSDSHDIIGYQIMLQDRTEVYEKSTRILEINRLLQGLSYIAESLHSDDDLDKKIVDSLEALVERLDAKAALIWIDSCAIWNEKNILLKENYESRKENLFLLGGSYPKLPDDLLMKKEFVLDEQHVKKLMSFKKAEDIGVLKEVFPSLIEAGKISWKDIKWFSVFSAPTGGTKQFAALLILRDKPFFTESLDIYRSAAELLGRAIIASKQDIEIRDAYERYRQLYDSAMTGIFRMNIDTGRFISANDTSAEILGYDSVNSLLTEAVGEEISTREQWLEFVEFLKKYGSIKGYEILITRTDKRIITILINARYLPDDGVLEGAMMDVTNLKELEHELKRKNEEMEAFIYSVSHDLKAPLYTIGGFVSLLSDPTTDAEQRQQYIDRIKNNSQSMSLFISKLLDLSRAGKVVDENVTIPLKSYLESMAQDYMINTKDVTFLFNSLPENICASYRIKEVFQNIISNSIDAKKKNSELEIEISCKNIRDYWIFTIKDNGVGINKDKLLKIFNPGYTTKSSSSRGSGFGLSISRRIVEAHGGSLLIESEENHGTTVILKIPMVVSLNNQINDENQIL
jgi:PAS domain S-box-containing protein